MMMILSPVVTVTRDRGGRMGNDDDTESRRDGNARQKGANDNMKSSRDHQISRICGSLTAMESLGKKH